LSGIDAPPPVYELIGEYLERSRLLGQRTAELHLALAGNISDPDFSPEPLSEFYRQGLYHAILSLFARASQTLRHGLESLDESARLAAQQVFGLEDAIRTRLRLFRDSHISGSRIRVHGNYNLSEVLYTGKDFVLIDFEGDPDRHLTERRLKRPPFADVASMLVSFHDAAHASRRGQVPGIQHAPADSPSSVRWADLWYRWVAAAFVKGYMASLGSTPLLPASQQEAQTLLNVFSLERFISEAEQFSTQDRDGLIAPLTGILRVIEDWPVADTPNS
jgi:maltose alpha-D-glucosyltransferase/alpha-amylase